MEHQKMPYNGPAPEQEDPEKGYNNPKSSRLAAVSLLIALVVAAAFLIVVVAFLPTVAERTHRAPTVKSRWDTVGDVAQKTCAERGLVFEGTSINEWNAVYRAFCAKPDTAEVTEIFINVVID